KKILEFNNLNSNNIYLNIFELKFLNSFNNQSNSRLIVHNSIESNFNYYNIDPINVNDFLNYNEFFKNENKEKWLGFPKNDLIIFYKIEKDNIIESPKLFLLYTLLTNNLDLNILDKIINENSSDNLFNFIKQLAQFCTIDNSQIIETSLSILYSLLLKDIQIINKIFKKCTIINDDSLEITILTILCISINEDLIDKNRKGAKIFKNIINYILISNERICEICIEVLNKLNFKNLIIEE
ncbi:hypothetical protein C6P40_005182, partial [Pichia californica]